MKLNSPNRTIHSRSQAGMTLIETVIALAILFVVAAGIMTTGYISTATTENQGNLQARTTEYAQDKMEQLIGLAYGDVGTDTTVFPSCSPASTNPPACATGTGLMVGVDCGNAAGTPCGSWDPSAPVTTPGNGFVDYLCVDGNPVGIGGCTAGNWFYIRVWQISQWAAGVKQITVTTKVRFGAIQSGAGAAPQSTLSSLKSSPF
jgi:Tfp pilus assembly protein PilE